jgi:crotonobetainyl-CoA:carnitine CoA-transferase CaiB-like acyl-CoA transferase
MNTLPLTGITVLECTHAVMGPTVGLLLGDMGAEVIHVEPPDGDATRRLKGFGTGYFPFYSRNKKSLAVDIKTPEGKRIMEQLAQKADVFVENFGPGTIERLGYSYEALSKLNERLIYCSLKGFLSGPYEHRHAMDEVVQMMGGLAYMTGPPGQPLRAGTSVVDITGGMFGVIGVLTALYERERTGKGTFVKSALFETTAFLMGQHLAYAALTDEPVPPMPARVSAWSVYRTFSTSDGEQVFIGLISDKHWQRFCEVFEREDWLRDERLNTNNQRIAERDWLLPAVEAMIASRSKHDVLERCERAGVTFAPIARPEDLFDDVHLNEGGSLLATTLPSGVQTTLPRLPLEMLAHEFPLRLHPPAIGEHTREVLLGLGYTPQDLEAMYAHNIIAFPTQQ